MYVCIDINRWIDVDRYRYKTYHCTIRGRQRIYQRAKKDSDDAAKLRRRDALGLFDRAEEKRGGDKDGHCLDPFHQLHVYIKRKEK